MENLEIKEEKVLYEVSNENSFAFIKNGIIEYFGPLDEYNKNYEGLKIKKSEIDFEKYNSGFDIFEENGKIFYKKSERFDIIKSQKETEEIENFKKEKFESFNNLKEKAEKLRLEYLTAELLPEGENKTFILNKLEKDKDFISNKIEKIINDLKEKFGNGILDFLIK